MPAFVLITIATAVLALVSFVVYALYCDRLTTLAQREVSTAHHYEELGSVTGDWRDYHRAQFAYKRAARLYMAAGQYPSGRWFMRRSVQSRRVVDTLI